MTQPIKLVPRDAEKDEVVEVLRDALAKAEAGEWRSVIVLGYHARERQVEICGSSNKSTDEIVGALERAKHVLLEP